MIALVAAGVLVVQPAGPISRLSLAVARARPGDTVLVKAGDYRENATVLVDKPITIRGEPGARFRAGERTFLLVTANNVSVEGLEIVGVRPASTDDRAAIKFKDVTGCRAAGNTIRASFFGIYGSRVDDCVIEGNRVIGPGSTEQMAGNAIHLWSSNRATVRRNVVEGHRDGIYLEFVRASVLSDNESHRNRRYGLHFMFSDSCRYQRNHFHDNGAGVAVMYSKHVTMDGNRFEHNEGQAAYGLLLKDISDGEIENNRFWSNTTGLYLEGSNRLAVHGNRFESNGWALRLLANATDNRFVSNVFLSNGFDVATNSRSATSTFERNYWDHYRGFDLNRDGFGDVPHRPVRLFSLVVEQNEPALILFRSLFVDLLDQAERVLPILTPEALVDPAPLMVRPR